MGKSWFYLSFWKGTPEDFTTYADIEIQEANSALAIIEKTDTIKAKIENALTLSSDIKDQENCTANISMVTEVLWYVD